VQRNTRSARAQKLGNTRTRSRRQVIGIELQDGHRIGLSQLVEQIRAAFVADLVAAQVEEL